VCVCACVFVCLIGILVAGLRREAESPWRPQTKEESRGGEEQRGEEEEMVG